MADLNEMLLVLMRYQRTETEMVRRVLITDIMEALVDREKLLTEKRVISKIEQFLSKDVRNVVNMDVSSTGLRYVTVNEPSMKTRSFKSDESLMDALAQCVHTISNDPTTR